MSTIKNRTWLFIAALFLIAQDWKWWIYTSVGEWLNRLWCIPAMGSYLPLLSYNNRRTQWLRPCSKVQLNDESKPCSERESWWDWVFRLMRRELGLDSCLLVWRARKTESFYLAPKARLQLNEWKQHINTFLLSTKKNLGTIRAVHNKMDSWIFPFSIIYPMNNPHVRNEAKDRVPWTLRFY